MTQVVSPLRCAAVIGAGTMGRGIVISLANAGLRVLWLDNNPQMVEQGLAMSAADAHAASQARMAVFTSAGFSIVDRWPHSSRITRRASSRIDSREKFSI